MRARVRAAPPALRVLHVFKDVFPPTFGGVEQHIWDITRSLGSGFRHSVLTASRSVRGRVDELDGVQVVRAPELGRVLSTPVTPTWWRELRRRPADVVHVHLPCPLAELACIARAPAAPVVASFHADIARNPGLARWYLPLERRFLARVARIVAGFPVLAGTSPALAAPRERVAVIPYGVDPDEWPAPPEAVTAIRGSARGRPLVLFLGRLVSYKGVDVLIEAMRSVDATLLVVGDGPARPALEAATAGLGDRVLFAGNVSNERRSAYYRAADVFVLPAVSRAESFGIAMLEAMAQGTPAISTEVGTGTSWVNVDGETGVVVPPRDPERLASALAGLFADDGRRKELGAAAAARARRHFSKRAMVEQLTELYRDVSASTRS
ncbi:MAG: glycosyltransferase [Acidimicrobiales bacterium]